MKSPKLVFVIMVVAIAASVASSLAQQGKAIRADPALRLRHLPIRYGAPRGGGGVILRGEPLEIEVGVVNATGGPPAAVERHWLPNLSLWLRPGGLSDAATQRWRLRCLPGSMAEARRDARESADRLILGTYGSAFVTCRVDLRGIPLAGGRYTLIAEWGEGANLKDLPPRRPGAEITLYEFEFREVRTEADRLDLLVNMGFRAIDDGRVDEARRFATEALILKPSSSAGLILRGRVRAAEGACRQAQEDWQLAAELIQSGSDLRDRGLVTLSDHRRKSAADYWRARASALECS